MPKAETPANVSDLICQLFVSLQLLLGHWIFKHSSVFVVCFILIILVYKPTTAVSGSTTSEVVASGTVCHMATIQGTAKMYLYNGP